MNALVLLVARAIAVWLTYPNIVATTKVMPSDRHNSGDLLAAEHNRGALSKPGPWSTKTWHTQTILFLKGSIRSQERALGMRATLGLRTYHNAADIAAIYEEMLISTKIALSMKMLKVKVDI